MYRDRKYNNSKCGYKTLYKNRPRKSDFLAIFYPMIKTLSAVSLSWRWLLGVQLPVIRNTNRNVYVGTHRLSICVVTENQNFIANNHLNY